jgi:hypothetical protein
MKRLWKHNGLSITLFGLFVLALLGQSISGHRHSNTEREQHGQAPVSYLGYLSSPDFLEATAENWESEFLQMAMYVILTVFLFQKGSSESKDPDKKEEVDRTPDPRRPRAPGAVKRGGLVLAIYRYSLSLALLLLFIISFLLHAVNGAHLHNEEQAMHGGTDVLRPMQYMATARFWFESFQNWQSEFLAVLAIVVLSVFLRQQGSPESKPVDAPHDETGGG